MTTPTRAHNERIVNRRTAIREWTDMGLLNAVRCANTGSPWRTLIAPTGGRVKDTPPALARVEQRAEIVRAQTGVVRRRVRLDLPATRQRTDHDRLQAGIPNQTGGDVE